MAKQKETKPEIKSFKAYCLNEGLTALEVAEKLHVSKWAVFTWYQGTRRPSDCVMALMQAELGLTPAMLFEFFIKK